LRAEWCRRHIKEAVVNCGLRKSVASECTQASKFCDEHSAFAECGSRAIVTLIRVRDAPVRERAISLAEHALKSTTPTGGKKKTRLTEREIKKLIERAAKEVRTELSDVSKNPESSLGPEPRPDSSPITAAVDTVPVPDQSQQQLPTPLQLQPAEQVNGGSASPPTSSTFSIKMCFSGICPDGESHLILYPGKRSRECDLVGTEITQLPHNNCPLLVQQREATVGGTTTAVETPAPADTSATKWPGVIQWVPNERQREYIDQMVTSGYYPSSSKVISAALDRMMESTPVARAKAELEIQDLGLGTHCSGKTGVYSST